MRIMPGPCGWTVTGCKGAGAETWAAYPDDIRETAAELAIGFVWAATGRRYGLCETTVYPCNPRPSEPLYQEYPVTALGYGASGTVGGIVQGPFNGLAAGCCGGGCSCAGACEVQLPGPVHSILQVLVDGAEVPFPEMRVKDGNVLVRLGGECWPTCQTLGVEIPTFQATYLLGREPTEPVQIASDLLACEYAKSLAGGNCALPARLQSLTRQGVEVTVAEVDNEPGQLRTGIKLVDDAIAADNPGGLTSPPWVLSPDYPPAVSTITWEGGS